MTASVKQEAKVRTNATKGSVCRVDVTPVKFSSLWASYPDSTPYIDPKTGKPPPGYEDQCAIKVSVAIHGVGIDMKSFTAANVDLKPGRTIGRIVLNGKYTATRADELASWLKRQPFCGLPQKPENITGEDWATKVKGRSGIVFFADYWARTAENQASGDHIDLWNGEKMTGFGTGLRARWNIVIPGIWSDLRKAKTILFFPIQ
jgi:hypothetical protein